MRVWYVLSFMGWDELRKLASVLGVALPTTKQEAMLSLSEYLQTEAGFGKTYARLETREKLWLQLFLFGMQSDGYSLFFPKSMLYSWFIDDIDQRKEAELVLLQLQRLGFLGKSHNWYASESFEFADELLPFLIQRLYEEHFVHHSEVIGDVQIIQQLGITFSRDTARFLSLMLKKPVGFTKNNVIYKREVTKVLSFFRTANTMQLDGAGAWEGVHGAIVMAVKLLVGQQLVRLEEGKVTISGQQVEKWLQISEELLFEWMVALTNSMVKDRQSHLAELLMHWVRNGTPGEWVPIHAVFSPLETIGSEKANQEWMNVVDYFVIVASATGIIDYGISETSGLVVRISKWPSVEPKKLYVQPNLELLVPEEAPLALHFLAGQLGELKRADLMSNYQLNKERILQLCDRGWTYEDIANVMEMISETQVAPSVLKTIRDWVGSYNRAVLWDAMLIHFQDSEWFHAFIHDRRSAGIMAETIGDLAVIIKRSGEKTAREILADIGAPAPLAVRKPLVEGTSISATGSKTNRANAEALGRVTGSGLIELLRMKLSIGANVKK